MLQLPRNLKDRLDILACPECHHNLQAQTDVLFCTVCQRTYAVKNHKLYFSVSPAHETQASDIKHWLRRLLGRHYKCAVRLLGPGFPRSARKLLLEHIDPATSTVVDLGSGVERIHPDVITLDIFDYPEVDIVCNLDSLPFGEGKIDAFLTTSVLEHIADVPALVDKMYRCTKAGGLGIHTLPFLFPFHESPADFVRYTHMGARVLFKDWEIRRLFNSAGPITVFNTATVEFLSVLASFGNSRVKEALYLALSALISPLKYLDMLFIDRPRFMSISAIHCIVVAKTR
jgi:SAM-dependent methyltransferase